MSANAQQSQAGILRIALGNFVDHAIERPPNRRGIQDQRRAHDTKKVARPSGANSLMVKRSSLTGAPCRPLRADLRGLLVSLKLLRPCLARPTPVRPVFHDPIQQRTLKTDIESHLLAFDPLVLEDFLALGE